MKRDFATASRGGRRAFVPIGQGWCIAFTDGILGTGVVGDIEVLETRLPETAIRAAYWPNSLGPHAACMLDVSYPRARGNHKDMGRRTIEVAKVDGRWSFDEYGDPLDFEARDRYFDRVRKNRFTLDMLYEYLGALSVPYDVEPRWPEAVMISRRSLLGGS